MGWYLWKMIIYFELILIRCAMLMSRKEGIIIVKFEFYLKCSYKNKMWISLGMESLKNDTR